MFTIITALVIMDRTAPQKAEALVRWFDPAILWIQRWLGAFYVPSLAMLPLTIQGIAGKSYTACSGTNGHVHVHTALSEQSQSNQPAPLLTVKGHVFSKGTV